MARILVLLFLWLIAMPALAGSPVSRAGVELIVAHEVGGPSAYVKRYQRPICPACLTTASGVTVGIGYDLRHQTVQQILIDWAKHPQRSRLAAASGFKGQSAVDMTRRLQDVVTPLPMAMDVLQEATLPRYWAIARRAFGPKFELLPIGAQDALTSLVYNRGGSTVGPARLEFRVIRDVCVENLDVQCIAGQILAMRRIWAGSSIQNGMNRRRGDEAAMAIRSHP